MRFLTKTASVLILAGWSSAAFAYTPQWLECTGDVTTTPTQGAASTAPAKDIYVFDPDAKNLFRYSEEKKMLSFLGAKPGTTDADMRWSGNSSGIGMTSWQGQFDRTSMSLKVSYKSDADTRSWSEHCAPTSPRPEAPAG